MIDEKMRKKLKEASKLYCKDVPYGEWDNPYEACFYAGASALDRMLSDESAEQRVGTPTQSDEEAATIHAEDVCVHHSNPYERTRGAFLAGVSFATQKHRPLVEEMLSDIHMCSGTCGFNGVIARAEALLGEKK